MIDTCNSCGGPLTNAVYKDGVRFCTNKKCGYYGLGVNEFGDRIE